MAVSGRCRSGLRLIDCGDWALPPLGRSRGGGFRRGRGRLVGLGLLGLLGPLGLLALSPGSALWVGCLGVLFLGVLVLVLVLGCRSRLGLRLSRLLARPDRPFRLV